MPELSFQPGIVIFADDAGKTIHDLLRSEEQLESNILLKNAVGLIYLNEAEGKQVYICKLVEEMEEKSKKIYLLKDAISELKKRLGSHWAGEDGIISSLPPAIYIIGSPSSRFIVDDIRAGDMWDGEIKCLFLCKPSDRIIKEEWDEWKNTWQVFSYDFFGNVSGEIYEEKKESTFKEKVVNALFTALSNIQTSLTGDDISKEIKDKVDGQLATVRKRALWQRDHATGTLNERSVKRYHRTNNTGQRSSLRPLPWIPLAALQEDTFQGEKREAYLKLQNELLQQIETIFQQIEDVQGYDEKWVEVVSKRHHEALKALENEKKLENIWNWLQGVTDEGLKTESEQILGSISIKDYREQLQSGLKTLHKDIEYETQTDSFHTSEALQKKGYRNSNQKTIQTPKVREEELRSKIEEQIYMTPTFHAINSMAAVVALTLAIQVWLFIAAFMGTLVMLLPLVFVLCLIFVIVGCRVYYKKAYIIPLKEKQEQLLSIYTDDLVTKYKKIENDQRITFIEKLQKAVPDISDTNDNSSVVESDDRDLETPTLEKEE